MMHIFTFIFLIFIIVIVMMLMAVILSSKSFLDREKTSPFECGFDINSKSRLPFSLRFFLITIIFLIFDVEIVLLLPAIKNFEASKFSEWNFMFTTFLVILLMGLFHEWNQGALKWSF